MSNQFIHKFQIGDRVEWHRAGELNKCTIIGINYDRGTANLKVDGWMGSNWEKIDHNFKLLPPKEKGT